MKSPKVIYYLLRNKYWVLLGLVAAGITSIYATANTSHLKLMPVSLALEAPSATFNHATGNNIRLIYSLIGHIGAIDSLAFSPDNQILFSGGSFNDGHIKLWSLKNGKQIKDIRAHNTAVLGLAISSNGQTLASCSDDASINFWQWQQKNYQNIILTRTFLTNLNNLLALAITPDSQTLITGGLDGIKLWDLTTQRPLYTLARFDNQTLSLAVNPNGTILASGNQKGEIKLWNLKTGKLIDKLSGHLGKVSTLAFSTDGQILVSGGYDRTVKIWDLNNRRFINTLSGHTGVIRSLAITPDGNTLATASRDGVRLWNLSSGELITLLSGHSDWVNTVAFSPDGLTLASGGLDRRINVWQVVAPVINNQQKGTGNGEQATGKFL